jgi:hypothetical protein
MSDDDIRIKAVDTALEWTKQVIALAAGTLVVSGTFIKDLFNGKIIDVGFLLASWIALCVCILFGLLFMGSLCSMLATKKVGEISIYGKPAQYLGFVHFMAFFFAVVFFAVFAFVNLVAKAG